MKNALECLLKEVVKMWCVLDYIHSKTVKGKNFNGIKALRKKAEVLGLESKILYQGAY